MLVVVEPVVEEGGREVDRAKVTSLWGEPRLTVAADGTHVELVEPAPDGTEVAGSYTSALGLSQGLTRFVIQ